MTHPITRRAAGVAFAVLAAIGAISAAAAPAGAVTFPTKSKIPAGCFPQFVIEQTIFTARPLKSTCKTQVDFVMVPFYLAPDGKWYRAMPQGAGVNAAVLPGGNLITNPYGAGLCKGRLVVAAALVDNGQYELKAFLGSTVGLTASEFRRAGEFDALTQTYTPHVDRTVTAC